MFQIENFTNNDDIRTLAKLGPFTVIEYIRDLSVMPSDAQQAYFCNEMNVRKRQVICDLSKAHITLQAGAMQWMAGNVNATTGVKGVGDLFSKAVRGKVTGESAIKPEYKGDGIMVLEPTYKHILLVDVAE
ncbi:AIM24 family protein [[Clostridium] innocuum]|nr:AIM24 family protein [[Clostridium] innocuum]